MTGLNLATLVLHIEADNQGALKSFTEVQNRAKLMSDDTVASIGKMGEKATQTGKKLTLGLTAPIVAMGAACFKSASDMDETISKIGVTFEENADIVTKWSDTSIQSMGMASGTALEMTALYGDMGKGMGLNINMATDYSMSLTQLAADMASFKNVSTQRAKTALAGVYTGETEALKSMGIVMTQTNLQQFAENQGITTKISNMTQAELVQLRYHYVMEKTKDAQGDFARTSDSAANQTRMFTEQLKELSQQFGDVIIPMIMPVITFLSDVVMWISELDQGVKKMIVTAGTVVAILGPTLMIIGSIAKTIVSVNSAVGVLSAVSSAFTKGAGGATYLTFLKWAGIITAVTLAVAGLVAMINILIGKGSQVDSSLAQMGGMMGGGGKTPPPYATGTLYHTGGLATVGEHGREIVELPRGARVKNNRQTRMEVENERAYKEKTDTRKLESLMGEMCNLLDVMVDRVEQLPRQMKEQTRMA